MITTKGRYALRVMIDLAQHRGAGNIPLKDIADRQDISKKYLEQIIPFLSRSHLLIANKGHMGGYKLSREPFRITVREILELMEGSLSPVACLAPGAEPCPRANTCPTLPMWKEYNAMVRDFFRGKKLSDFTETPDPIYYI